MDAEPVTAQLVPAACAPARGSPEPAAQLAPRPTLAGDVPAACSDISDQQLLAVTDTAGLTADQLDRRHHLLRHSLPDEVRGEGVLVHFEAASVHEAVKMIKKMSQRDLQAKFRLVYGAKTFSNNNNWLRRKLFEAIGVDPAKGAVKKASAAGGGGRRRRGGARGSVAKRAPAKRAPKAAAAADWFPAYAYGDQYAYGYVDQYEEGYGCADEEVGAASEDEGVCEALLALGAAADALEESFSEASGPSVSVAPVEPTPASTATDKEDCQAGGSAAFRRLLLEQAEAQAAALPPPAAMAEWMALLHQQAAVAGAWAHHPFLSAGWQPMPMVHPGMLGALLHQPASVPPLFTSK